MSPWKLLVRNSTASRSADHPFIHQPHHILPSRLGRITPRDPHYLEKQMTIRLIAALAVSLATVAFQSRADVVKVGVIAPMSGPFSAVGQTWEGATKTYQ